MVTVITKTIGSGKDYASFTLAEADVPNIVGSRDLVGQDKAVVFEADAGTYNESVTFDGTLATDATRNVTYKPAAGSEHGGVFGAGVVLEGNMVPHDDYLVFDGISINKTFGSGDTTGIGGRISNCMIECVSGAIRFVRTGDYLADPYVYENCAIKNSQSGGGGTVIGSHPNSAIRVTNCAFIGLPPSGAPITLFNLADDVTATIVNNLVLFDTCYSEQLAGSLKVTGSNNFGGSTNPFPVALQGSPYPVTPSTAYDPGAGDFALYVGKNGALLDSPNNDVIGGGVGPSVNSDVPTTDILGNARSGATANPGAFEVPQATAVLTRTIGPVGRDYATFTLAEADVTNIGASADLVFENERIVFEADAATYSESVTLQSTLTTDATRNVTYKPAAGSEHGGVLGAGVHIVGTGSASCIQNYDDYTSIVGLSMLASGVVYGVDSSGVGVTLDSLTIRSGYRCIVAYADAGRPNCELTVTNTVMDVDPAGASPGMAIIPYASGATAVCDAKLVNCTVLRSSSAAYFFLSSGGTVTGSVINCLSLASASYSNTGATVTGSNNFGGASGAFPVALQGSPYPITASQSADPGAGDYALYVGKNGALLDSPNNDVIGQGVGPAANSDVPLYDIIGNFRAGDTANPGAFEIPQATYTWKKTIGPVGRDYATFTLAEADVTNIPTSTDLVNENEAIVFEAVAGTYNESVTFSSTLTSDATRNVTYKPAAGSEHGGDKTAGVILTSSGFTVDVYDAHTNVRGLVVLTSTTYSFILRADGAVAADCIVEGQNTGSTSYALFCNGGGTASSPVRIENCVGRTATAGALYVFAASDINIVITNMTGIVTGGSLDCFRVFESGATATVNFTNCLAINTGLGGACQPHTATITGSNNFGSSINPFPVAIQGSPYPVTPTTDTDPGPGDWAIYDAATGALINDSDNDVLAGGVGPSANSDVPETDIVGNLRSGSTADPGAFEISSIPAPLPGLSSDMQQTYQAEAAYTLALTPSGVTNVTHQLGPGPTDYLRVNPSTESREVKFPDGVQAVRVVATANSAPCSVTVVLSDGAGGEVESDIGYVGGAALSADYTHLWNLSALQSDGSYPKLKFTREGTWTVSQDIYVWWHTS